MKRQVFSDLYGNNSKISSIEILHKNSNGQYQTIDKILNRQEKILWEGVAYLNGSQTANLKEKISEQPHGVVLIWSGYDVETGQEKNYNYRITYIPKYSARLVAGTFEVFGGTNGIHAFKYFYINDEKITGNNVNQQTVGGFDNRTIVLRYVVGF